MPPLAVGDTAPDFELPIRAKDTLRLSETLKKGPVVLLTYIFDFSPG
jgi:peroxiredoxin